MKPPKQSPWNRSFLWYYTEYDWKKTLVAGLPWLAYMAAFSGLIFLTMAHLRRESLNKKLRSLPLSFRDDKPRFGERALVADLQPLRQMGRDHVREIDPVATALATAACGGLLTPRYSFRPIPADFVALIDRRSIRDHFAAYGDALVDTLRSAGLFVEQFDFDRAPWICRRRRTNEIEALNTVLTDFPNAIYLLFLSEDCLIDSRSGAPQSWLDQFRDIDMKVLIVQSVWYFPPAGSHPVAGGNGAHPPRRWAGQDA